MASAVARAHKRGLGGEWVRGRSRPEAKVLLVFGRSVEAANLPTFLQFGNAKKSDMCVHGWPRIWERAGAKLGEGGCTP